MVECDLSGFLFYVFFYVFLFYFKFSVKTYMALLLQSHWHVNFMHNHLSRVTRTCHGIMF